MTMIRALGEGDLQGTYAVLEQVAGSGYGPDATVLADILAATLAGQGATVVAISPSGQLIGAASVLMPDAPDGDETADASAVSDEPIRLALLWVDPQFRRRGIGRALMASFAPVWSNSKIEIDVPEAADFSAVEALFPQFAFKPVPGTSRWRTKRVRRTTGRASLAFVRPSR